MKNSEKKLNIVADDTLTAAARILYDMKVRSVSVFIVNVNYKEVCPNQDKKSQK
jgi:hypothetical protein